MSAATRIPAPLPATAPDSCVAPASARVRTECRRADGTLVVLSPSDSAPGASYETTATSCTCPAFRFRQDPAGRCKHIRREFPRFCGHCGTEPVDVAGDVCSHCAALLAAAREYCGCGRGRRPLSPFSVCALCVAEENALMAAHLDAAERHALATYHAPLRLVR